jgi:hypothetical protein
MKNIHLLPTDKPSRLLMTIPKGNLLLSKKNTMGSHWENKNIHITSDEEVKEGDWLFANQGANKIVEIKEGNYPYGSINNKGDKIFNSKHWKTKIILTTDPDLIADGVQEIDDEFLEWFVKNPSCEEVKVSELRFFNPDTNESAHCKWEYDLPQEEPKQETLEEAADNWVGKPIIGTKRDSFIAGAKWQTERMYSEEDLRKAYFSGISSTAEGWNGEYADGNDPNIEEKFSEGFTQWFEQFKKEELTFKSE